MTITVRLQAEPFNPGDETNQFIADCSGAGAAVTFTGLVRSTSDHPIQSMTLEHYPALAQSQLADMANRSAQRFELLRLTIIHRFGKLLPGDPIVQVMTLASHRQAAFDGANFVMDFLKTDAPFWKKEQTETQTSWVESKTIDDDALKRWNT